MLLTPQNRLRKKNTQRGFTLIELLATLAIILIITLIARSGKTLYERSLFLTNLAYDVALTLRQAQVYGVDVRAGTVAGNQFDIGYGVYFTTADPTHFTLFIDQDNDHTYNPSVGGDTVVQTYTIQNNNRIYSLCAGAGAGSACGSVNTLYITFRRPDPGACINTGTSYPGMKQTSDCVAATGNGEAQIVVAPNDATLGTRVIDVLSTGQISVQ